MSLFMARNGHGELSVQRLLLGVKPTIGPHRAELEMAAIGRSRDTNRRPIVAKPSPFEMLEYSSTSEAFFGQDMRRRDFITLIGSAGAAWPFAVQAQLSGKFIRIGYLGVASPVEGARGADAFETGLRELGYVPGKDLIIEYRWAQGRHEQLDVLAKQLVRLPVDILFAPTTPAALAAKKATETIPIIFATANEPVELGLVASLARPGGNVTGLTYYVSPEIVGKQLQMLKQVGREGSRVAVLWFPSNQGVSTLVREAKRAAESLSLQLQIIETHGPNDLESAFGKMREESAGALLVLPDARFTEQRAILGNLALKSGLPTMFGSREDLAIGALMAYGPGRLDLVRRAASYVDKILNGVKPADLPVQQPIKFELIVNLATARALGITIPPLIIAQADEVIE
jgi:putative ABC transport system substrate-binding protein